MDLLSKLPFLKSDKTDHEAVVEAIEAKKARIQFHRDHVRNGPSKFKDLTTGQIRRLRHRELNRSTRKARRAQVKGYFENQRLAATVRGHLQLAGVLPLATIAPRELDRVKQVISTGWLVQRFGTEVLDEDGEPTGHVSFDHDDVLVALGQALHYFGEIVGIPNLQVPDDYVVPVYVLDGRQVWIDEAGFEWADQK